jgi:putative membrane protein
MQTLLHWLISALAILVAAYLIPGAQITLIGAFVLAVVLGLINITLKPILFILTLPITILTLGLFSLVINAALIMLASLIVPGFIVAGFWTALLFSIVLSLINLLFGRGWKL